MPKQFDIFVDEYQSAEGTNQEFDVFVRKILDESPSAVADIDAYKQAAYTESIDSDGMYVLNFNGRETPDGDKPYSYLEYVGEVGDPPSSVYVKFYKGNAYTSTRVSCFDIYVCDKAVNKDITVYSLPFRTTTRVDNNIVISIPDDAMRNYVKQTAKIDASLVPGSTIDTHVTQTVKAASDMVVNAVLSGRTNINSGMVIDVSIGGTTLWRYRLLNDMDSDKLSVYDDMTLGNIDIVVL